MNIAINLIAASLALSLQGVPTQAVPSAAPTTSVTRTYKVGDEATYVVSISDSSGSMHMGAKIHVKTLALVEGGKATQELTATEFSGGPSGAPDPTKVTWTFGKDGLAAADFDVQSGSLVYSLLSMLSVVGGATTSGKEFKVAWTSPDKMSTITGSGTCEGTKELKGAKVAVIKTTLEVTPSGQPAATVHNTANFDPVSGKLLSAEGTLDIQGMHMTLSVTSG